MTALAKFSKSITLCLAVLYILSGSGLDKLTFQTVSLVHRTVVFPCKGKGCQCDKAGYELSNCQCNHDEGVSCCSTQPQEEESCCSDEEADGFQIANIPCQGVEESLSQTLGKHLVLLPHIGTVKNSYTGFSATPYLISINEAEFFPRDKVPI